MRAIRGNYTRGGRGGSLQCNIPSHIGLERTAENADQEFQSQDQISTQAALEAQSLVRMGPVRAHRVLQTKSLQQRARLGAALAATTLGLKILGSLFRSPTLPPLRTPPKRQLPRFPKVVGVQTQRPATTAGSRRGMKGGAFRFPKPYEPRQRWKLRKRYSIQDAAGADPGFFQPGEEGF